MNPQTTYSQYLAVRSVITCKCMRLNSVGCHTCQHKCVKLHWLIGHNVYIYIYIHRNWRLHLNMLIFHFCRCTAMQQVIFVISREKASFILQTAKECLLAYYFSPSNNPTFMVHINNTVRLFKTGAGTPETKSSQNLSLGRNHTLNLLLP